MGYLALTYSELDRDWDALAMQQSVLELYRRVLPEDHPDIGEGHVWSAAACCFADCDGIACRLTCRPGHGQSC